MQRIEKKEEKLFKKELKIKKGFVFGDGCKSLDSPALDPNVRKNIVLRIIVTFCMIQLIKKNDFCCFSSNFDDSIPTFFFFLGNQKSSCCIICFSNKLKKTFKF